MYYSKFITDKIYNEFKNTKTQIFPIMGNHEAIS